MNSAERSYKPLLAAAALCLAVILAGCGANAHPGGVGQTGNEESPAQETGGENARETSPGETVLADGSEETPLKRDLTLQIDGREMPVTWLENESVEALKTLAAGGMTVRMSMYGGFEQVGPLGASLPRDDKQTLTSCGDIVLYSGNQIVVFYGSNSWSYTRLGHIDLSREELTALLSKGNVEITLTTGT